MKTILLSALIFLVNLCYAQDRPCNQATDTTDYTVSCIPVSDSSYQDTGIVAIDKNCWKPDYHALADGTYKIYKKDSTGRLFLFQILTNKSNLLEDRLLTYDENGKLTFYATYEQGVPTGLSLSYNSNGQITRTSFINLNGKNEISGTQTIYWETGTIASARFINNHKVVYEIYFDKDGKPISKTEFDEKWHDCNY